MFSQEWNIKQKKWKQEFLICLHNPSNTKFYILEKSRIHFEKRKQLHVTIEDPFIQYPTSIFIA